MQVVNDEYVIKSEIGSQSSWNICGGRPVSSSGWPTRVCLRTISYLPVVANRKRTVPRHEVMQGCCEPTVFHGSWLMCVCLGSRGSPPQVYPGAIRFRLLDPILIG